MRGAGHKVVGDTMMNAAGHPGSALVARAGGPDYFLWTLRSEEVSAGPKTLKDEGFRVMRRIQGVDIHTDGVRLVWKVRDVYVWLMTASTKSLDHLDKLDDRTVDELVKSSVSVPYP